MSRATDPIRDYLADALASGAMVAGQKLPTERELAGQFKVSRTVVRDALSILEAESRIVRHVGRGTFVADGRAATTTSSYAEPVSTDTSPAQLLEARGVIESELAALAVLNATDADLKNIETACRNLKKAKTVAEIERSDADFHRAIAVAAHNALLLGAYDLVAAARDNPEWRKLKAKRHLARPARRNEVFAEHRAILDALEERDAAAARRTVLHHLDRVRANLLGWQDRSRQGY